MSGAGGQPQSTPYELTEEQLPGSVDDDIHHMKTHDLKQWLQDHGADLTGVVERSELEKMARQMKGCAQAAGGTSAS